MVPEVKKRSGVHRASTVLRGERFGERTNKTRSGVTYEEGSSLILLCEGISEPRREERKSRQCAHACEPEKHRDHEV